MSQLVNTKLDNSKNIGKVVCFTCNKPVHKSFECRSENNSGNSKKEKYMKNHTFLTTSSPTFTAGEDRGRAFTAHVQGGNGAGGQF